MALEREKKKVVRAKIDEKRKRKYSIIPKTRLKRSSASIFINFNDAEVPTEPLSNSEPLLLSRVSRDVPVDKVVKVLTAAEFKMMENVCN